MKSIQNLKVNDILTNQELCDIFGCSPQGGMRRSHKTNTLILISKTNNNIYEDRWLDDVFHYTGMGTTGDQSLDFMQNKTLNESNRNDIEVHLFENPKRNVYVYLGQVFLSGEPYLENQTDADDNSRNVYVFPLKLK